MNKKTITSEIKKNIKNIAKISKKKPVAKTNTKSTTKLNAKTIVKTVSNPINTNPQLPQQTKSFDTKTLSPFDKKRIAVTRRLLSTPHNPNITAKELAFIDSYIETLDPIQSLEKAGFHPLYPEKSASALLSKPHIIDEIHSRLEYYTALLKVTKAYIVKNLLSVVEESNLLDPQRDKNGEFTGIFKMRDPSVALRAVDSLAKHLKINLQDDALLTSSPQLGYKFIDNLDYEKI